MLGLHLNGQSCPILGMEVRKAVTGYHPSPTLWWTEQRTEMLQSGVLVCALLNQ